MSQEPAYVTYWVGKRVEWKDGKRRLAGLVIDINQVIVDRHQVRRLKVARDDGYIEYGLDVTEVEAVHTANEESKA